MKKRWIVGKRMLACENRSCDSYGLDNACRVETLGDDGSVLKICKTCKAKTSCYYKAHSYKEQRACANPNCRHVRDVTVSILSQPIGGDTEMFEKHCDACRLERSAASHLHQAHEFQKRASEIRAKRKKPVDTESRATVTSSIA